MLEQTKPTLVRWNQTIRNCLWKVIWVFAIFYIVVPLLIAALVGVNFKSVVWGPGVYITVVEAAVLLCLAYLSTRNYYDLLPRITMLSSEAVNNTLIHFFMFLNLLWFLLAFVTLLYCRAPVHLFFIFAIFATFSASNILGGWEILACLKSSGESEKKRTGAFLLETTNWLQSENGPNMVAYGILLLVAVTYTAASYKLPRLSGEALSFFVGGAAVFHLAVSVTTFRRGLKDDPLSQAFDNVDWQNSLSGISTCVDDSLKAWMARCSQFSIGIVLIGLLISLALLGVFICMAASRWFQQ
jgi:hypothetical protein